MGIADGNIRFEVYLGVGKNVKARGKAGLQARRFEKVICPEDMALPDMMMRLGALSNVSAPMGIRGLLWGWDEEFVTLLEEAFIEGKQIHMAFIVRVPEIKGPSLG